MKYRNIDQIPACLKARVLELKALEKEFEMFDKQFDIVIELAESTGRENGALLDVCNGFLKSANLKLERITKNFVQWNNG